MADASKHPSNGGNSISDFQTLLSPLRARRSKIVGYVLVTAFVACTVFLAFNPSAASSPWFSRFFSAATPVGPPFHVPESSTDVKSDRSVPVPAPAPAPLPATGIATETRVSNFSASLAKKNGTLAGAGNVMNGSDSVSANRTHSGKESVKNESKPNPVSDSEINHKNRSNSSSDIEKKGYSDSEKKKSKDDLGKHEDKRVDSSLDSLKKCNMFQGRWVKDDSYPLYKEGSCSLIDESFDCFLNGRKDQDFLKLRWQPHACTIPRLNASDMLERLRGKRLVFVGDSLNRNMWESMVCVLRNSVKDKSKVYEKSGRSVFRTEGSASFLFQDYNCSVEFFRAPFLVQEWQASGPNGSTSERLRLDLIERKSDNYKQADIIVFNTGHWWTHEKTSRGKDYYQEGSHVYGQLNVVEAFRKALVTWARWVDANVNPHKTLVFFRGFSATHFSGGRWNSGGACDRETQPIYNEAYLSQYPEKMSVLERVIKGMKTPISYLNITRMTDYRKDGHPSIYRKQNLSEEERRAPERFQDCSHWCLPGVPDTWNEILYAQLISKQH